MLSYQKLVCDACFANSPRDRLTMAALGLAGEAGEYADLVKKALFHKNVTLNREKAISELGDVLWYLALAAAYHEVTLNELARKNIAKLYNRYSELYPDPEGLPLEL